MFPFGPSLLSPTISGTSSVIAGLQKAWFGDAAALWSRERSLVENLQAVLQLQLPPKAPGVGGALEGGWGGSLQQQAEAAAAAKAAAAAAGSSTGAAGWNTDLGRGKSQRNGGEQLQQGDVDMCPEAAPAAKAAAAPAVGNGVDEKLLECAICYAYHLPDADASAEGRYMLSSPQLCCTNTLFTTVLRKRYMHSTLNSMGLEANAALMLSAVKVLFGIISSLHNLCLELNSMHSQTG